MMMTALMSILIVMASVLRSYSAIPLMGGMTMAVIWESHSGKSVGSWTYGMSLELDSISKIMMILLGFVTLIMLILSVSYSWKFYTLESVLFLTLVGVFLNKSFLMFYSLFEASLIPISVLIMGWGYQPERVSATMFMLVYTVAGSMPLLAILVWLSFENKVKGFFEMCWLNLFESTWTAASEVIFVMALLAFMAKLPVYCLHLWLPKAHVEAPLEGSVILAGLLLKLGGFGMIYMAPIAIKFGSLGPLAVTSLSGLGGAVISMVCLRVSDMKMLIAYSSVSHMAFCSMAFFTGSKTLMIAGTMVMVAHGLSSPGMFTLAYILYSYSGSRSLLLNNSMINKVPVVSMLLFILCLTNMSAPPSLNLLGEVLCIFNLWWAHESNAIMLGAMVFFSGAYTLVLYVFSQHGLGSRTASLSNPSLVVSFMVVSVGYVVPAFFLFLLISTLSF